MQGRILPWDKSSRISALPEKCFRLHSLPSIQTQASLWLALSLRVREATSLQARQKQILATLLVFSLTEHRYLFLSSVNKSQTAKLRSQETSILHLPESSYQI